MLAMILANIAAAMTGTLIPLYLTELGVGVGRVGLVFTLTSIVVFTLQIMGGWISDNIGRLRAIATGRVSGIFGFVAMLLAPTWQRMIIALAVYQIPFSLVGPSFGAFLAENSTEDNRSKVYGLTGSIYQIVGVLGPPLGGFLAAAYGFKAILLVATIFYVLAVGLRIWMASFYSSLATLFGMMLGGGVITWIFITDGISDLPSGYLASCSPSTCNKWAASLFNRSDFYRFNQRAQPDVHPHALRQAFRSLWRPHTDRRGIRANFYRAHDFLAGEQLLCLCLKFGRFQRWRWSVRASLPVAILYCRTGRNAGHFLRRVRKQPRIHLPARSLAGAQLWEYVSPQTPFLITSLATVVILPQVWFKFKAPKDQSPATPDASRCEAAEA